MSTTRPPNAIVKVVVRPAPNRKGFIWEQRAVRGGNVQAVSPKTYDDKALAKRAGQRQVNILNSEVWEGSNGPGIVVLDHHTDPATIAYLEVRA